MAFLQAILLAIIQGLTEFLPVSSSGHLVIAQDLFGVFDEPGMFFELLLHVATLLAIFLYFRHDLRAILTGWRAGGKRADQSVFVGYEGKTMRLILYASIPTAALGLVGWQFVGILFQSSALAGAMMVVTGTVLYLSRYRQAPGKDLGAMTWRDALLIGIAQGIAVLPGISRSGFTIAAALFCGLQRDIAARFSFLLSIPAILGAALIEGARLVQPGRLEGLPLGPGLVAVPVAAAVGYFALRLVIQALLQWRFHLFAYYCWAVGGIVFLVALFLK